MSQQELLIEIGGRLDRLGIAWMTTGSFASSLQGEPRASHDIDVVVLIRIEDRDGILDVFADDDFYLSRHAIDEAIRRGGMFNLLKFSTGDKVDFWVLNDDAFDRTRFARRLSFEILPGKTIWLSSPEDTILKKLDWMRESGGSEKQFNDALGVYETQFNTLNRAYLEEWVLRLDLTDSWNALLAAAIPES
ncbi:MAG: hypothetical protein QM811_31010 [Pirellulales bacterium]